MFILVKSRASAPLDLGIPTELYYPAPSISEIKAHSVHGTVRTQTSQPHGACWSSLIQQFNNKTAWMNWSVFKLGKPNLTRLQVLHQFPVGPCLPLWHLWRISTGTNLMSQKKQPPNPVQALTHPNQDFAAQAVLTWFDLQFLAQIVQLAQTLVHWARGFYNHL